MARAIAVASGAGDVQAVTGSGTLVGYSVRETAGSPAAATLTLRDGTSAAGAPCVFISLAASTSLTAISPALDFSLGLFVDRVTGTSEIALYII